MGLNTFVSICGNTTIDMRDLQLPLPENYHFVIVPLLCGNVKMLVPRGTNLSLRRFSLCGSKNIDIDDDVEMNNQSSAPTVKVTVVTLCGDIRVVN